MKTIFIINPCAGQGENINQFISSVKDVAKNTKFDIDFYITKSVGDATDFVKYFCEKHGPARFIACGGDGTLNEILNGAISFENAEIGAMPQGTGNDFCRNFSTDYDFSNVLKQVAGKTVKCDAIKYSTLNKGRLKEGYCVNMFNIGFDCNVADLTADIKKKPFISGSFAYLISILLTMIKKKCINLHIELDGKTVHDGKLLLTSIANGCYCGGGIKSNPLASVKDGFININIIKNVTRLKFISILPYYMKGTFLDIAGINKYISSLKCRELIITPNDGEIRLCVDGEIINAGKTTFEIKHHAFNFVVPGDILAVKSGILLQKM